MYTIIKIDHDEGNHRAFGKWYEQRTAFQYLADLMPLIRLAYPGAAVDSDDESSVEGFASVVVNMTAKARIEAALPGADVQVSGAARDQVVRVAEYHVVELMGSSVSATNFV